MQTIIHYGGDKNVIKTIEKRESEWDAHINRVTFS
jgi:hypothetical protein